MGQRILVQKTLLNQVAARSSETWPYEELAKAVAMEVSVLPT